MSVFLGCNVKLLVGGKGISQQESLLSEPTVTTNEVFI
jgi:hypothetical protein